MTPIRDVNCEDLCCKCYHINSDSPACTSYGVVLYSYSAPAVSVGMSTGNFYLFWLLLVTGAFLYNAAVGPLRTAFSMSPIYNVTGVYPPAASAASQRSSVVAVGDCSDGGVNNSNNTITSTDAARTCSLPVSASLLS